MKHGKAGTPEHSAWLRTQMNTPEYIEHRKIELADMVSGFTQPDLVTLRSIINGKLGKRKITPEQQAKMQAARKLTSKPQ